MNIFGIGFLVPEIWPEQVRKKMIRELRVLQNPLARVSQQSLAQIGRNYHQMKGTEVPLNAIECFWSWISYSEDMAGTSSEKHGSA